LARALHETYRKVEMNNLEKRENTKLMKKLLLTAVCVASLAFQASADFIQWDLNLGHPTLPAGGDMGPYGSIVVNLSGGVATIDFTAYNSATYGQRLFLGEGIACLNVSGSFGFVSYTGGLTPRPPTVHPSAPPWNVDGFGNFNLVFDRFDGWANGISTMEIVLSGSWSSPADVLTPNTDGYWVAAHVGTQGGAYTGWASVPDGGTTLLLLGSALGGLGLLRRKLS
jgi:hypothetical protein